MNANEALLPMEIAQSVARHSLGWLVAANAVGVWLALALLWPEVGDGLAPLTYGRWMPLHHNWQLYGWCSLPWIGVLLTWCFAGRRPRAEQEMRWALRVWTFALLVGGLSWLAGNVSGKLFLDWHGWARGLLPAAMIVLWLVLAAHVRSKWAEWTLAARRWRAGVLGALATVPVVFYWSTARSVYPAVNPHSGGATGTSLLGSTLGIVTLFLALPELLRVTRECAAIRHKWLGGLLVGSWGVFALLDHGDVSHHVGAQSVALGVLLAWIPLLGLHWRACAWPAAARPWIWAALGWWALLVASGWTAFLPGFSEALKFTHGLVAHAHLAMAGLLTSVNGAILVTLCRRAAPLGVWLAWQLGCVVHVAALSVLGWFEVSHVAGLMLSEEWSQGWLLLRFAAGVSMTAASVVWWREVRRS